MRHHLPFAGAIAPHGWGHGIPRPGLTRVALVGALGGLAVHGCTPEAEDNSPDPGRIVLEECPGNYQVDRWDTEGDVALISSCEVIEGDLRINLTDERYIEGLQHLREVSGHLYIGLVVAGELRSQLTSIDGLANLVSVGGDLSIVRHPELTTIGLDSLTTVGGDLTIHYNAALCTSDAESFAADVDVRGATTISANNDEC